MAEQNFHHRPEHFPGGGWTGEAARKGVEQVEKMAKTFGEFPTDFMKGQPGKEQRREEDDTSDKWIDDVANRVDNDDAEEEFEGNNRQRRPGFPQEHPHKACTQDTGKTMKDVGKNDTKAEGKDEDDTSDKWIDDIANRPGNDDDEEEEEMDGNNSQRRPRFPQEQLYKDNAKGGESWSTQNEAKAEGKDEDDTSDKWIDDIANRPGNDDDEEEEEEIDGNKSQCRPRFPQEHLYKDNAKGGESWSAQGGTQDMGKTMKDDTSDKWIDDIANRPGNDDDEEKEFEVNDNQRGPRFP